MTEKIKIAQGKEKKSGGEMRQHNKKSGKVGEQGDPTKGKEKGGEGGGREKPLSKGKVATFKLNCTAFMLGTGSRRW